MKRLLSMLLAVMMVLTLGTLPVAAEHEEHTIKFVDAEGNVIGGSISLEATVGQTFTHTFNVSKCGGTGEYGVTFSVDSEALPDWLRLDGDTGVIRGTPTAETGEGTPSTFCIKVDPVG